MILQVEWDWWSEEEGFNNMDLFGFGLSKKRFYCDNHLETIELNCSLFNSFPLLHSHDMTNDMHPLHGLSGTTSPL